MGNDKTKFTRDLHSGLDIRKTDNSPKETDAIHKAYQAPRGLTEEEIKNLIQDMQN